MFGVNSALAKCEQSIELFLSLKSTESSGRFAASSELFFDVCNHSDYQLFDISTQHLLKPGFLRF